MCKLQSFLHMYEYLQTYSGPVSTVGIAHSALVLKINLVSNMLRKKTNKKLEQKMINCL